MRPQTQERVIHFIAQVLLETIMLRSMSELGSGRGCAYAAFYGRGYMRLTWPQLYCDYGQYRSFPDASADTDARITATSSHCMDHACSRSMIWSPCYDPDIVATELGNAAQIAQTNVDHAPSPTPVTYLLHRVRGWTTTVLCLVATYTQQACSKPVSTDRLVPGEASAPIESPAPPPETPPNQAVKTDSELARDFPSVQAYGQHRYPSFAQDDQITIEPIAQTPLAWLVDSTPKINGTWHLFEQSNSGARYLLCHVSGDWMGQTPTQTNGTWGPIEMVETIQPQGHQKTVRYEFSASLGFYVPTRCWRSEWPTPPEDDPAATASVPPTIVPLDCRKHVHTCD